MMNTRTYFLRIVLVIVCTLCLCLGLSANISAQHSPPENTADLAKKLIVKVKGEENFGAGIVVGHVGDIVFVATANHVVRKGREEAQNLRVEFNFWFEEFEAKLLEKFDRNLDLAVLLVDLKQSTLSSDILKEFLPLTQLQYVIDIQAGNKLYPVGHPAGHDWYVSTSPKTIFDVEGERILIEFECSQGFSGGGVFDEQWGLAGMIRAFNPPLCEAISFARIQEMLEKWRFAVSLNPARTHLVSQPTATPTPGFTAPPTPTPTATPKFRPEPIADQERHDPVSGIDFVWVPEGCFQMGCVSGINCQDNEKPVHEVCLDGFWMGKTEVTQEQWEKVMGENPSNFKGDNHPVERVSWNDVQDFLQKLNKQAGKEMYRLPSEAEWEYAVRAGTEMAYSFGDDAGRLGEYAWYGYNSDSKAHPVGQLKPNARGLHDMHGNVWEWCADSWHDNYKGAPSDGSVWEAGGDASRRVLRGGSWSYDPYGSRSAERGRNSPDVRRNDNGFRVVVGSGVWTLQ